MSELFHLLLVDDEIEIRNGMGRFFPWDQVGFQLSATCENGRQAFDYVVKHPVDAVLCDIRMPVMDGLTFAKQVREAGLATVIIFFSAHRDFEYARQALVHGVRHYIVKSAKYDEMLELFRSVAEELRSSRKTDQKRITAPVAEDHHLRLVSIVTTYVLQHLGDNPNLENMARHVGLSPDHLGKVFKVITGRNFSDFLMTERMQKAAAYLSESNLKTYEVGAMVGYYNAKNFTRAFKAYHGVSPREYRHPGVPDPEDQP